MRPFQSYYPLRPNEDTNHHNNLYMINSANINPNSSNAQQKRIRPSSSNPYINKEPNVYNSAQFSKGISNQNYNDNYNAQRQGHPNDNHRDKKKNTSPDTKSLHDKFLSPYDQTKIASMTTQPLTPSSSNYKPKPNVSVPFLPEKSGKNINKKTLILDLDETLVHSSFKPFSFKPDISLHIAVEHREHIVNVLKRPYVNEFLLRMSKCYELVIFTASVSPYANPLLDKLDQHKVISHRLFREHCVNVSGLYIKDLKKVGRDLKDTIILDNNPISYLVNKENGLPILTWHFDKSDTELLKLIPFLEYLSKVPDVRHVIRKVVVNNGISLKELMSFMPISNNGNEKNIRSSSSQNVKEKQSNQAENSNHKKSDINANAKIENYNGSQHHANAEKKNININIVNHHVSNVYLSNEYQQESLKKTSPTNKQNNPHGQPQPQQQQQQVQQKLQHKGFNTSSQLNQKQIQAPIEKDPNANHFNMTMKRNDPVIIQQDSHNKANNNNNNNYYDYLSQSHIQSRSDNMTKNPPQALGHKDYSIPYPYNSSNAHYPNSIIPHPYVVKELSASPHNYYISVNQSQEIPSKSMIMNNNSNSHIHNNNIKDYFIREESSGPIEYYNRPKSSLLKTKALQENRSEYDYRTGQPYHQYSNYSNNHYGLNSQGHNHSHIYDNSNYTNHRELRSSSTSYNRYPSQQPSYYSQEREVNVSNLQRYPSRASYNNESIHRFDTPYRNDVRQSNQERNFSMTNRDRFYRADNNSFLYNS